MNQQVSEPFSYDYSGGWKGLLVRSFPMAFLLIGLAVCIIISPIFAYEYQTGTDAVILSAKYGRRETVRAKIAAGFLVTSGIYAMAVLCNFVSIFAFFGIKGWNCDFQIMYLKSFYSLKIWQVALIGIIINYIVVLSIMAFTMLMSAVCKTPFAAVIISTLCTIAPMFISESKNSRGINHIISLLPAKAMDTYSVFSTYILFTFGRVVLTLPYMILITAVVVIVFTLSIAYRRFCRHQVA